MLLRSPTLAATTCFMILVRLLPALATPNDHHAPPPNQNLICIPFGTCEPCPAESLHEPFCQPFGNRLLVHCTPSNSTTSPDLPSSPNPNTPHLSTSTPTSTPIPGLDSPDHQPQPSSTSPAGAESLAWVSCGRIVAQERADFFEFVACNILFAIISLFLVFARSRRLQALQARQLAARIGLVRTGAGSARR